MLHEVRRDALCDVGEYAAGGGNLGAEIEESLVRFEEEVGVENVMAEGATVGGADGGSVPAGTEKDVIKGAVCGREDSRWSIAWGSGKTRRARPGARCGRCSRRRRASSWRGPGSGRRYGRHYCCEGDIPRRLGVERACASARRGESHSIIDVRVRVGHNFELGDDAAKAER